MIVQYGDCLPLCRSAPRPHRPQSQQACLEYLHDPIGHLLLVYKILSMAATLLRLYSSLQYMLQRNSPFGLQTRNSNTLPFLYAMGISTLLTLATFLPLLFRYGLTSPIPDTSTSSYPDPIPCLGNCSWIHDPSLYYEDGTYWRFSTSGNIAVATAPSLKGPWTYKGPLLPKGTSIQVADAQDIWVRTCPSTE